MKIENLIARDLVTADPSDTLGTIKERMADLGIHALPVVDELGKAIGIVTSSDIGPDLPDETPVADLMSDQIYPIGPEDTAKDAAGIMRDQGTHHLVVSRGDRAIGIVSSFDLLRVIEEM